MDQPIPLFAKALSQLDQIVFSSLHLCGASSLRDDINKLLFVKLESLASSARAEKNISVQDLISIATIRKGIQQCNIPAASLDEILKRRIQELDQVPVLKSSVGRFQRLMELRELLAPSVGFDCGPLDGLITKVLHELQARAVRESLSLGTAVEKSTAPASPFPVQEIPETPQKSPYHNLNDHQEAGTSNHGNEETRDSSSNQQDPPMDANASSDSSDDEVLVLRNRAASFSLTESQPNTPERGRTV